MLQKYTRWMEIKLKSQIDNLTAKKILIIQKARNEKDISAVLVTHTPNFFCNLFCTFAKR